MRVLVANLKHFYQRRSLCLFYAIYGLFTLGLVGILIKEPTAGKGEFSLFLVLAFPIGQMVGLIEMEVVSKSISFCLPGHRRTVRRLVFLAGVVTSFILSLPFVVYPGLSSEGLAVVVLTLVSGLCANFIAYLIGLIIALSVWNAMSVIGLLALAVIVFSRLGGGSAIERSILYRPDLVILLAAMTTGAVWLWLGRPALFRKACATPWVGFLDPWDRSQTHKFRHVWARRFRKAPHPGLDRFFLDRIRRGGEWDPSRYIWGALYTTSTLIEPQWTGLLLLVWTAVIWAGYAPRAAPFLIPVVALMLTGFINPPVYSELPVAGSRRERAFATMAQILALAGFSTLIVGLSILVLNSMMPLVPVIEVADLRLSYQPVDFRLLLPLVLVFPMMGMVRVLFHRNPMWLMLGTTLLLGSMVLAALLVDSLPPAYVAATAGALWVVCFAVVHRIATRSDLVRR